MKKVFCLAFAFVMLVAMESCNGGAKNRPKSQTYEQGLTSGSTTTRVEKESPYIDNHLSTGETPYSCEKLSGSQSKITVKTGSADDCDVVVIVKSDDKMVANAYIAGGDSFTFNLPNGTYQVFFYGGKGWNPNKEMPNGETGGFVANESFSKDEPVTLNHQGLSYELILQRNGNFSTEPSSASEMF